LPSIRDTPRQIIIYEKSSIGYDVNIMACTDRARGNIA